MHHLKKTHFLMKGGVAGGVYDMGSFDSDKEAEFMTVSSVLSE